jgi:hypothetical protein
MRLLASKTSPGRLGHARAGASLGAVVAPVNCGSGLAGANAPVLDEPGNALIVARAVMADNVRPTEGRRLPVRRSLLPPLVRSTAHLPGVGCFAGNGRARSAGRHRGAAAARADPE